MSDASRPGPSLLVFSDDWGRRDPAETLRVCAERFLAL